MRSVVEALPGAGCISVERHGDAPGRWLRVFPEAVDSEQEDGGWSELTERITATVHDARRGDR